MGTVPAEPPFDRLRTSMRRGERGDRLWAMRLSPAAQRRGLGGRGRAGMCPRQAMGAPAAHAVRASQTIPIHASRPVAMVK